MAPNKDKNSRKSGLQFYLIEKVDILSEFLYKTHSRLILFAVTQDSGKKDVHGLYVRPSGADQNY